MVSCNIGHIFFYIIAIVLWISNMMRACLWTLQFWKINFQGLTLTHCIQGVPKGYCAMSYIISNPHSRTIWSSKSFRIHPLTAEKTTRFLFRGTFGHTVGRNLPRKVWWCEGLISWCKIQIQILDIAELKAEIEFCKKKHYICYHSVEHMYYLWWHIWLRAYSYLHDYVQLGALYLCSLLE